MKEFRTCQKEAILACQRNNKGILRMCCGSGKTLVEIALCHEAKVSCLIAPRNALLTQHSKEFNKFKKYRQYEKFKNQKMKLVVINCENDFENTKPKKNEKICYIINNLSLNNLPIVPDIVVVDEAHTYKNPILECKSVLQAERIYFFTATPQDMDNTEVYGETIYKFDYLQALTSKYVVPFKIVPIWNNKFVAQELAKHMKEKKLTHCIHFYDSVNGREGTDRKGVNEVDMSLFKNCKKITQKTTKEEREEIFKKFKKKAGGHLLSCKTISYGIDIKECDCVYLDYVSNSVPDMVQKIMRAIRIFEKKPNKIAYVFVSIGVKEPEEGDITEEMKKVQQSIIFQIASLLKEGMDLDILGNYHPFKRSAVKSFEENIKNLNNLNDQIKSEIDELQNQINKDENDENENDENDENDEIENIKNEIENKKEQLENIKECIDENKNLIGQIEKEIEEEERQKTHKSAFHEFFDDYNLQLWYENGEITSRIEEHDWPETLKAFFDDKKGIKPKRGSKNTKNDKQYNKKTEKQIAQFISEVKIGKSNQQYKKLLEDYGWLSETEEHDWPETLKAFYEQENCRKLKRNSKNDKQYNKKTEEQIAHFINGVKSGKYNQQYKKLVEDYGWLSDDWPEALKAFFDDKKGIKPKWGSKNDKQYNKKTEEQIAVFISRVKSGKVNKQYKNLVEEYGWLN